MVIFLLTSLLAFLFVSLALLIKPSQLSRRPIGIPFVGELDLTPQATRNLRRLLMTSILIVGLAALWLLLGGEASLRSRYLPNFLFGLIFGPVFAIWIGGILYEEGKFSIGQTVIGIILIVLFIAGLLGQEAGRRLDQWTRRITKLGVGGAEVIFADSSRRRDSGREGKAQPPPSKSGAGTPNASPALDRLAGLDLLIERDCAFVAMAGGPVMEDCSSRQQAPANEWSMRDGADFAGLSISSYARCLAGVFETTLDKGMVDDYLRPLALRFQELSVAGNLDNGFVDRALETHLTQTQKLLDHLFPVFLTENVPRPAGATSKPKIDLPIRKSCATLVRLICDKNAAWYIPAPRAINKPRASIGTIKDSAEEWVDSYDAQLVLKQCKTQRPASPASLPALQQQFAAFYAADKDTGFRSRPYAAIAQASLLMHLESYEAGLSRLHQWIDEYERDNGLDNYGMIAVGKNPYKVWYAIRARASYYIYMNLWISRDDSKAPDIVRDLHLANLQRYLQLLRLFPPAAKALDELNFKKHDFESDNYRTVAIDMPVCKYPDDKEASIIYSYLATGNLFAYHALRHRDYDAYSGQVRQIVKHSVNVDTSCIAANYPPGTAAALRSESLELQAEILMKDAERQKDDAVRAREILTRADAANHLALQMVSKLAEAEIDQKKRNGTFVEIIWPSKVIEARDTALRTKADIRRQLDELE
jgi:hypothetical protein